MLSHFKEFDSAGRIWIRQALSKDEISDILSRIGEFDGVGQRNIQLPDPIKATLLNTAQTLDQNLSYLMATAFNKHRSKSWSLPWHQDRILPFSQRINRVGYENWTRKSGTWYCEPPEKVLSQAIFAHILLDDVNRENGPMEMALASHALGRIRSDEIKATIKGAKTEFCTGKSGDIVLLKFLLLHRSVNNKADRPRRTLRVDFAPIA